LLKQTRGWNQPEKKGGRQKAGVKKQKSRRDSGPRGHVKRGKGLAPSKRMRLEKAKEEDKLLPLKWNKGEEKKKGGGTKEGVRVTGGKRWALD